jgi:hypothetical protein
LLGHASLLGTGRTGAISVVVRKGLKMLRADGKGEMVICEFGGGGCWLHVLGVSCELIFRWKVD